MRKSIQNLSGVTTIGITVTVHPSSPFYGLAAFDLVGVLVRAVKSRAADREIDDFMIVTGARSGWQEARPVARTCR